MESTEITIRQQLTVGDMLTILNEYCPSEKVALHTDNDRYLYIIGINERLTQINATPTFDCIMAGRDKAEEEVIEVLKRQKEAIEAALAEAEGIDKKEREKKKRGQKPKAGKAVAAVQEALRKGYIPQKKGKALKIQTADQIRYKITTKQRDKTLKELDPTLNFEEDETTERLSD